MTEKRETYDSGLLTKIELVTPPPTLEELCRAHNRAKQAVLEWLDTEGKAGNLRGPDQAPAWGRFQDARAALWAAIDALGVGPGQ